MSETRLSAPVSQGDSGPDVRRAQEWLTLRDISVVVDGEFGAATDAAVRVFQQREQLPVSGAVDESTFAAFVAPIAAATAPTAPTDSLGADICTCALQHVAQKPREVGGENCGPWVRLYMDGAEGTDEPWCAGFATFVMMQAAGGRPLHAARNVSCDALGASAKARGTFRDGDTIDRTQIPPGSLFLVRRTGADGWHHTGIVVAAAPQSLTTIEGNTNDTGSREGFEAIQRIRGYTGLDFIVAPS